MAIRPGPFLGKETCPVSISVGISLKAMETVTSLVDTGAILDLVRAGLLLAPRRKWVESTTMALLWDADGEIFSNKGIKPLFTRFGHLCVHAWFGFVDNPVVNVLIGISNIHHYVSGILSSQEKSSLGIQGQGWFFQHERRQMNIHRHPKTLCGYHITQRHQN